jgi:HTH-type transcriptional regulator/antitoxin HigA
MRLTTRFAVKMGNTQLISIKQNIMLGIPYKVIKTATQYKQYCSLLEALVVSGKKTRVVQDEIELLSLLIEKYDADHNSFSETDPIELLKSLMNEHAIKAVDLANLLGVSEGLVSDMLNYKKGLSKETIRLLASRFKLRQEAFNRPYALRLPAKKNAGALKPRREPQKKYASI